MIEVIELEEINERLRGIKKGMAGITYMIISLKEFR